MSSTPMVAETVTPPEPASRWSSQMSFDELGRPLRDLTFCVVDLETTGAADAAFSPPTVARDGLVAMGPSAQEAPQAGHRPV